MVTGIQPRTALEEFVMKEEIYLADREDSESFTNRLTRKVTVRLGLHEYAAITLLASRYGGSPTRMAEHLLSAAATDAVGFSPIPVEQIDQTVQVELDKLNAMTGGLEILDAAGIEISGREVL